MPRTTRSVKIETDARPTLDEIGCWLDDCFKANIPREARPAFGQEALLVSWDFPDPLPAQPVDALTAQLPVVGGHPPDMAPAALLRRTDQLAAGGVVRQP